VGGEIRIGTVQFEFAAVDRLPELSKGSKCVLFLTSNNRQETLSHSTVGQWFAIHRSSEALIKTLETMKK
jgi:hypothetical protein